MRPRVQLINTVSANKTRRLNQDLDFYCDLPIGSEFPLSMIVTQWGDNDQSIAICEIGNEYIHFELEDIVLKLVS